MDIEANADLDLLAQDKLASLMPVRKVTIKPIALLFQLGKLFYLPS